MANLSYTKLFELFTKHDFFGSGFTDAIALTPVPETARLFTDNKVLFRKTPTGIAALYRDTGTGPFLAIDTPAVFTFAVSLSGKANTAEFLNITDLSLAGPVEYSQEKPFLFANSGAISTNPASPQLLAYSFLNGLRPSAFTYTFPFLAGAGTDTGTIDIKDPAGNSLEGFPKTLISPNDSLQYTFSVNLTGTPGGKYRIITSDTTPHGPVTEYYYIDNTLAQQKLLGFVELSFNTFADLYTAPTYFNMQFLRRSTKWRYYIINKSGNVTLANTAVSAPVTPVPYVPVTFSGSAGPVINGSPSWVFVSSALLPFFETPLSDVHLKELTSTLIDDLPNPAREGIVAETTPDYVSEIFVYV
jgi:hypothetical protein